MNKNLNIINNPIINFHHVIDKYILHNFISNTNDIFHYIQNLAKNILNILHIYFIDLINNLIYISYNSNYYLQKYNYYLVHIYYQSKFHIQRNIQCIYLKHHIYYKILLFIHNFLINTFHLIIHNFKNTLYILNYFKKYNFMILIKLKFQ